MNKKKSIINLVLKYSWRQKVEAFKVLILFLRFSILTKVIPLRFYYDRYVYQSSSNNALDVQLYFNEVRLIKRVRKLIPWKTNCLINSLVIKAYLKTVGVDIPIFIGVSLKENFLAHAWCTPQQANGYVKICHNNES